MEDKENQIIDINQDTTPKVDTIEKTPNFPPEYDPVNGEHFTRGGDIVNYNPQTANIIGEVDDDEVRPAKLIIRFLAALADTVMMIVLIVCFINVFSTTPLYDGVREAQNKVNEITERYMMEPLIEGSDETVGKMLMITEENKKDYELQYTIHTLETGEEYVIVQNEEISEELIAKFNEALQLDEEYQSYIYSGTFTYLAIFYSIAGVIELIWVFGIPMISKKRATVGKLITSLSVVDKKTKEPAKWWKLLIRWAVIFVLGTAVPYYFFSEISIVFVAPIMILVSATNKDKRTIHDFAAGTMVLDTKTYRKK